MADLETQIINARKALAVCPDNGDKIIRLHDLGAYLYRSYFTTGALTNLDEAIQLAKQALDISTDDPGQLAVMHNLGRYLSDRYTETELINDLHEAIYFCRRVSATSQVPLHRSASFDNLGVCLKKSFAITLNLEDLSQAIDAARQAVQMAPEARHKCLYMYNLGIYLDEKYRETSNESDLDSAIELAQQYITISCVDEDRAFFLNNLGGYLADKYLRTSDIAHLMEAVDMSRRAVNNSADDPNYAAYLSNLGSRLGDLFVATGTDSYLQDAIFNGRLALAASSNGEGHSTYLNNLGNHLGDRYQRVGDMGDLEEAIRFIRLALETVSAEDPDRPMILNNMATRLHDRYRRTRAMGDLQKSITLITQAIAQNTNDNSDQSHWFNSLANRLTERAARTSDVRDLDEAIRLSKESVRMIAEGDQWRLYFMSNLANLLGQKYQWTSKTLDLHEAIRVARQVIEITPPEHPNRGRCLYNLSTQLGDLYRKSGSMLDLTEGIQLAREAVERTPPDNRDRAQQMQNLGNQLGVLYKATRDTPVREEAALCLLFALRASNSNVLSRIQAGVDLLGICPTWELAYDALQETVHLVPSLILRPLNNHDKQYILGQITYLSSDAAEAALEAGKGPIAALELLEMGLGILGSTIENLRTDTQDLEEKFPEVARRFQKLQEELDQNSASTPAVPFRDKSDPSSSQETDADHWYDTNKEMDKLLCEIRKLPEFANFLLPIRSSEMQTAAIRGPVVVINVNDHRCDAIIIEIHQVKALPLLKLSSRDIEKKVTSGQLGNPQVLKWLWDTIAEPILNQLGHRQPVAQGAIWPHIWWIPTGPLIKFPLHAAGYHERRCGETVIDRVISSYSSSVKAILSGRRRHTRPSRSTGALLVAMQETPGGTWLDHVMQEVTVVRAHCKSMGFDICEPPRRKKSVISQLQECSIFHFAGHGYTDLSNPLDSCLQLEDWKDSPLRVTDLLEIKLHSGSPFLAYLSACGTSKINETRYYDQGMHLISACQLAGFRHVIGTLWDVNDEICVDMARLTYEGLREGDMTDDAVCLGLHKAARTLRDRWLKEGLGGIADSSTDQDGITSGTRVENGPRGDRKPIFNQKIPQSLKWVPYVHYGV